MCPNASRVPRRCSLVLKSPDRREIIVGAAQEAPFLRAIPSLTGRHNSEAARAAAFRLDRRCPAAFVWELSLGAFQGRCCLRARNGHIDSGMIFDHYREFVRQGCGAVLEHQTTGETHHLRLRRGQRLTLIIARARALKKSPRGLQRKCGNRQSDCGAFPSRVA